MVFFVWVADVEASECAKYTKRVYSGVAVKGLGADKNIVYKIK